METKKETERKFQIQRDLDILKARDNGFDTPVMIEKELGISYAIAFHTFENYKMIAAHGDEYEYIDIALELCELLDEAGCNADRCTTLIMRALWVEGFNTRAKIGKIPEDKLEALVNGHRIHRAGKKAVEVFLNWQKSYAKPAKKVKTVKKAKPVK